MIIDCYDVRTGKRHTMELSYYYEGLRVKGITLNIVGVCTFVIKYKRLGLIRAMINDILHGNMVHSIYWRSYPDYVSGGDIRIAFTTSRIHTDKVDNLVIHINGGKSLLMCVNNEYLGRLRGFINTNMHYYDN